MTDAQQQLLLTLKRSLHQARFRKLRQHASLTLPWLVVVALGLFWGAIDWLYILGICIAGLAVSLLIARRNEAYQALTLTNLTAHANRQYESLEESCQLLLCDSATLSLLQRLQQTRVAANLTALLDEQATAVVPAYPYSKGLWATLLLTIGAMLIWLGTQILFNTTLSPDTGIVNSGLPTNKPSLPRLLFTQVNITPPDYALSKYPAHQQDTLNLRVFIGSQVTWRLRFADPGQNYFIRFANSKEQAMSKQQTHDFQLTAQINRSSIYQITDEAGTVLGLYSIEVIPDDKPKIRFISPLSTITELATNANPIVQSQVQISDDLGVEKIQIEASIAKGTGEGVKFRDQLFEFDGHQLIAGQSHYFKRWQLVDLGMEPGDELYFSVKVWDNHPPQGQLSRSTTKIIRWLEDSPQSELSDGTLVNFVPDYFKSQRQIIIETKQLIAEKAQLSNAQFKRTSQLLGQAQSDLKHKYGQFLGDEVDNGAGGHTPQDGVGLPQLHINDGEHGNAKQPLDVVTQQSAGHQHPEPSSNDLASDKSGLNAIIIQYGHAHGDTDIGNTGKQNPKALMKRAIANMWQAEAQLLQNAPDLALPFENQALDWLNRAKNAERIYVKRLGFEPPPVSEKRRYQADLTDILSYQRKTQIPPDESDSHFLAVLLHRMNQNPQSFETSDPLLITPATKVLNSMLAERPGLIDYVVTLEKIKQANSWQLDHCDQCKERLQAQLWRLLPNAVAAPASQQRPFSNLSPSIQSYAEFLHQQPKASP